MCKAPVPGLTKTRLGKLVGPEMAAHLSASFLCDLALVINDIPKEFDVQGLGVYAPAGGESALRKILPESFELLLQSDTEFGRVLLGAIDQLLQDGHDCAILVNGDSPTLPRNYLIEAVCKLRQPGNRMVLGPAADGGYYLIGLKTPHARLFEDIPWGTSEVARLTIERAHEIALETLLLPQWYDVDDAMSLEWLREEMAGTSQRFLGGGPANATRACLAELDVVRQ
jgi:rSAM/selenodomain-associated transferase 1